MESKKLSKVQKQNIKYLEKRHEELKRELDEVQENTPQYLRLKEKIIDGILVKERIYGSVKCP